MRVWSSSVQDGKAKTVFTEISPEDQKQNREMRMVTVHPEVTGQVIHGFGGAFTDAAGFVYSQMDGDTRREVIQTYFGRDGLGYTMGRTHLDSCDFAAEMYAADDDPADAKLEHMDFSRNDRYVLPLIRDAQETLGQPIRLMLSPWSPPAYMKTNSSRVHGGKLLPEYCDRWALYIAKTIEHCLETGLDIRLLSVQNEPNASQTWDSCLYTGEEERDFIREHLVPVLRERGLLDRLCLLIWDHNKERLMERSREILTDAEMETLVGGMAFHWYTGDHFEELEAAHRQWPDKRLVFSEGCVEHSRYGSAAGVRGAVHYAHEILGDLKHGADTFLDWNLLLDEEGGPNHVGNYCDAPLMYNRKTRKLILNPSLTYIGHFSKYFRPGSQQICVSTFDSLLEVVGVRNPDGSLAVTILNRTGSEASFYLRIEGDDYALELPPDGILTAVTGN